MSLEPHQIPSHFACKSCDIIIPNEAFALVAPSCGKCAVKMSSRFVCNVRANLGFESKLDGIHHDKTGRALTFLRVFSDVFRASGRRHENVMIDDRSGRGPWPWRHVHKAWETATGRIIKDAEGDQRDPAVHGPSKRRFSARSRQCGRCTNYALVECVSHGGNFCIKHGIEHLERTGAPDALSEIRDDPLS